MTTRVKSSELSPGDVVLAHGLRLLVEQAPRPWGAPPENLVYATKARILNPEYLRSEAGRLLFGGIIPLDAETYTIQGNDLATWAIED